MIKNRIFNYGSSVKEGIPSLVLRVFHFFDDRNENKKCAWLVPVETHYRLVSYSGTLPKILIDFKILENGQRNNTFGKR